MRIAFALALLALIGCSDEGDPVAPVDEGVPRSYAADIQTIFDTHCGPVCHGSGGNGGLDLRAPGSWSALVGVTSPNYPALRVAAGRPDLSVLFDKISGGETYGASMPLGGPELDPALVERVREWILAGAPEGEYRGAP